MTLFGYMITLLLAFQVKHFIVDFVLQNTYMLGKFKERGWFWPLMAHTSMHGVATLIILLMVGLNNEAAIYIALGDIFIHNAIDRCKVLVSSNYTTKDKGFWVLLGADQMLHHLTHYFIILMVVAALGLY